MSREDEYDFLFKGNGPPRVAPFPRGDGGQTFDTSLFCGLLC